MDILAHALWTGAGLVVWQRKHKVSRRAVWLTLAFAVLPDVALMLPVTLWAAVKGSWSDWLQFVVASPGTEPWLPAWAAGWSHHLHCTMHSVFAAALATALAWVFQRGFWLPLAGWWGHIVVDVFTHSKDFYPVPLFYPFTDAGFDGVAWITPWFMVLNYAALAAVFVYLALTRPVRP